MSPVSKTSLTITHITTATAILNVDGINFLTDPFFGAIEGTEYDASSVWQENPEALKQLGVRRAILVGHSWGGSLALAAAVAYPEELSGIVLLAPAAYPSVRVEWWSRFPRVPVLGQFVVHTLTPLIGRAIVRTSLKEAFHPQPLQEDYAEQSAGMWTTPGRVSACAYDERTLRSSLRALSPRYCDIQLPVVIVTGSADLLLAPQEHAYQLHKTIKGSELVVLPETGHQLPQTRPDSVIDAVKTAWRAVDQRWN